MGDKKKLLIFTDTYSDQINGAKITLEALTENLGSDIDVSIVSADGFHSIPFPTYAEVRFAIVTPRRIERLIHEYQPDMIHIATEGTIGFAAARACQKIGASYTSAFHTKFPEYISLRLPFVEEKYVHRALRYIHDSSACIIVSSTNMQDYLEKNYYPKEKISVIPFGVDHVTFCPGKPTLFADLPRPILLFVGRVAIEKNIGDFLAMETAGTKVVVGDGPLRDSLEETFPEVRFLGSKSKKELANIYRSSDIFVFPSLTDTLGLVNIEALACGLPVLAYDVEGPRSIISHGTDGVLIPYGKPLASGLQQISSIDRDHCIAKADTYSWKSYTEEFLSIQSPINPDIWI